jgi:type II secretory pathway predicted ATPase ExeA
MFLDFYGLREQPFGVTPDPTYLYPAKTHCEALGSLSSGIQADRGFMALIAEPGMGKTTLLYRLLHELRDSARTVFLFQTQCDSREFFQYVLHELGVDTQGMGLVAMHTKLNSVLFDEMLSGKRFVLVVDESQNLSQPVLETVRLLSNFETQHAKLLQIVLAGQPGLAAKLARPELSQLRQRITVMCHLEPLNIQETACYVEHRLHVAGYSGESLFAPDALEAIVLQSKGIPRDINTLCYNSLSAAYRRGHRTVTSEIVREALTRFAIESSGPPLPVVADRAAETASAPLSPGLARRADLRAAGPLTAGEGRIPPPLTYEPRRQFSVARWISIAVIVTSVLLFGSLHVNPSILRFAHSARAAAVPPSSEGSSKSLAPSRPANFSEANGMAYAADPIDTGSVQVLTVVARPQQTLKEISLIYVGHFDDQLFGEICSLNPELKDPDHVQAGQLIRLPLPPDSLTKVIDTSGAENTAENESGRGLFTKVVALLRLK